MPDQPVEHGRAAWRRLRLVAANEAPQHRRLLGVRDGREVEQDAIAEGRLRLRRMAVMDVPDRVLQLARRLLGGELAQEIEIVVDRARDHVEIEPLGRARLLIHEERQAFGRRIAQPFLDREAVALRLRDLLPLLVEEELVIESLRRAMPEDRAEAAAEL